MSDYTKNKDKISGNYPLEVNKLEGGAGAAGFSRVEQWPSPERLRNEYLFGIPLVDRITKIPMSDDTLKSIIRRAAARVELETRIDVFPVQRVVRREFDRTKYLNGWNQIDLGYKNVQSLQEISIRAVNSVSTPDNPTPDSPEGSVLYNVPLEWIDTSHFPRGLLHFVPLQTTFSGTGIVGGATMGAAAPLFAVFSRLQWIPSFWFLRFTTGFQENSIPGPIFDLICLYAAIDVLSMFGPLNRWNSQSIGMDGVSQGVAGPGNQLFAVRIQDMQQKAEVLKSAIRSRFAAKFTMDYI